MPHSPAPPNDSTPTASLPGAAEPASPAGGSRRGAHHSPLLIFYARFEQGVSLLLAVLLSALVVVTLAHLTLDVGSLLLTNLSGDAAPEAFQVAFGTVMTVLIALEFNHTILSAFDRRHGIIQMRTVLLIALLALVRKFILLDVEHEAPLMVIGLAAAVLALGGVYRLMLEPGTRSVPPPEQGDAGSSGRA